MVAYVERIEPAYTVGDATLPPEGGNRIIGHICNDEGHWGAGFVLALSARWKLPEQMYRSWAQRLTLTQGAGFLGQVQIVEVQRQLWVANMIAQHGIGVRDGVAPIRYGAVQQCLERLADHAKALDATVHLPRIGCGLAGGSWDRIEPIIQHALCDQGVQVTIYDLAPLGRAS